MYFFLLLYLATSKLKLPFDSHYIFIEHNGRLRFLAENIKLKLNFQKCF